MNLYKVYVCIDDELKVDSYVLAENDKEVLETLIENNKIYPPFEDCDPEYDKWYDQVLENADEEQSQYAYLHNTKRFISWRTMEENLKDDCNVEILSEEMEVLEFKGW